MIKRITSSKGIVTAVWVLGLVVIWEICAFIVGATQRTPVNVLPHLYQIIGSFFDTKSITGSGDTIATLVFSSAAETLSRALIGFIIGMVLGYLLALLMHLSHIVEKIAFPYLMIIQMIPILGMAPMGSDVGTNPELVAKYTAAVRRGTKLPVLAKMTPNITNMEIPAIAAVNAGADGIAAINTVKSITNIDLDSFVPTPDINGKSAVGGYSGKAVKPIALRFISDMKRNETLENVEISGMGGIETWRDGLEFILMGCTNLQVTTSVMQYGYRIIDDMLDGLSYWLTAAGYNSVSEVVGLANKNMTDAGSLDRDTVTYPIFDKNKCIGCGRCYIACYDAGHQALDFDSKTRKPVFLGSKCVGCHLCATVCPVNCISKAKRVAKKH